MLRENEVRCKVICEQNENHPRPGLLDKHRVSALFLRRNPLKRSVRRKNPIHVSPVSLLRDAIKK
jgi:hypothetical protein